MPASVAHPIDPDSAALDATASNAALSVSPAPFPGQQSCEPVLYFVAGNEIYAEGDAARSFYKVVSGVVRTCRFLCDGRRQIDGFYLAEDIFGFEARAEHRLAAEAVSDCCVIPVRRRGFDIQNGHIAEQMFSQAMHCFERARDHALLLGRRCAAQKLAAFLLEMAERRAGNAADIDLAMTRQDIADYLGLTIETVSRTLSQLERDGLIALPSARRIHLRDRQALREMTI